MAVNVDEPYEKRYWSESDNFLAHLESEMFLFSFFLSAAKK